MRTKLIILGSGNSVGVPRIDGFWGKCNKKEKKNIRTRCSAIIQKGSNSILIDTSPDIKNQLILNKIRNLSSVIFSHEHSDQTNGLFELRPFYWKYKKKINVYGNYTTMRLLKKRFDYCFKSIYSYPPIVKANIIKNSFSLGKSIEKVNFKAFQVKHGPINSTAYVFEKTAYLSDCNDMSIVNKKILKNLKYLIIDCLRIKKSPVHFNLENVLEVHRYLKPKKTILTNLNSDLDYNFLLQLLPNDIIPAYDGLKLNL